MYLTETYSAKMKHTIKLTTDKILLKNIEDDETFYCYILKSTTCMATKNGDWLSSVSIYAIRCI